MFVFINILHWKPVNVCFNPSCTKGGGGGGWDNSQRFFEDNSAQNESKLANLLLIQVR